MHCRLLVPDLFPPDPAFAAALGARRFPSLETLIARGRRGADAWESLEQWLLESFSVTRQRDWPSAPFALLGDGGAPGDDYWLHAGPVHLRAEGDHVLPAEAELDASESELQALAQSVNSHFESQLHLEPGRQNRWYARLASPPAEPTLPLSAVLGRPVDRDSLSIAWHTLMNEIQMLLHEHPVNQAREARGEPVINALWLWGGGRLSAAKAPDLRKVLTDHPLAAGLAAAAGLRASPPPEDFGKWLERSDPDGVHLAVLTALCPLVRHAQVQRWVEEIESLERRCFQPLVRALKQGRIGMVSIHLAGETELLNSETTRSDLRHFWHRRRPLAHCRTGR
jgi:hypothetical protein